MKFSIPHPSGWNIVVRLAKCEIEEECRRERKKSLKEEDLEDGFVIKASSKIVLKTNPSDVLLANGVPECPEEMTFKVADIPHDATHPTIKLEKERWVDVVELKKLIASRSKPFILDEVFEANLSSGTYLIKVSHVKGSHAKSSLAFEGYRQSWKIGDATEIEIETEEDLEINLIGSKTPIPLENATFQITSIKIPENGLVISKSELKSLIDLQGPKTLVKNQCFEITTGSESCLELKLIDSTYSSLLNLEKKQTVFGTIEDKTTLYFATPQNGRIKVVDKVYSEEIEKIRFFLSAVKRKGVESYARLPLVLVVVFYNLDYFEINKRCCGRGLLYKKHVFYPGNKIYRSFL